MTFKILIIEDEPLAQKKITRLLTEVAENIDIVATITSNKELTEFLQRDPDIDVIFSDIELTDGPVFNTYQTLTPKCPIIFITAYNDYMMEAFDTTGIAYLLKPFNKVKLEKAWQKFINLQQLGNKEALPQLEDLLAKISKPDNNQTKLDRIAIKAVDNIYFLDVDNIVFVKADGGVICAFCKDNKRHYINESSLQSFEDKLNNDQFFRISRSELVHKQYVEKLERYCKNTYAVYLYGQTTPLKTSQSKTAEFSKWIGLS